jgi:polyhydroxyalkanoate synthesis repressor PhaR
VEIIKKYANRKLYHTSRKSYITLSDIATLAAAGHDLQIIDNERGSDITAAVVAQAMIQSRDAATSPVQMISGLLQLGGGALESVRRGVRASLSRHDDFADELTSRLAALVGAGLLSAEAAADWHRTLLQTADQAGRTAFAEETRASLDRLRREVQRLSSAVDELSRRQEAGAPTGSNHL